MVKLGIVLVALSLLAISCSRSADTVSKTSNRLNQIKVSSLVIESNSEEDVSLINLGEYSSAQSVLLKRITIQNNTGQSLSLDNLKSKIELWDENSSTISIFNDSCSDRVLAAGSSCFFDIKAEYHEQSSIEDYVIPLTAQAEGAKLNFRKRINEGYLLDQVNSSSAMVASVSSISFGTLTPGSQSVKRVYISNTSESVKLAAPQLVSLPLEIEVIKNTCVGFLASKKSCFYDLRYSHQPTNLSQAVSFSSAIANIPVSAVNVQESLDNSSPVISMNVLKPFPEFSNIGSVVVRRVVFTNNSSLASYTFGVDEISSQINHNSLEIINNYCDGEIIRAGKFCFIDIKHSPEIENQSFIVPIVSLSARMAEEIQIGASSQADVGNSLNWIYNPLQMQSYGSQGGLEMILSDANGWTFGATSAAVSGNFILTFIVTNIGTGLGGIGNGDAMVGYYDNLHPIDSSWLGLVNAQDGKFLYIQEGITLMSWPNYTWQDNPNAPFVWTANNPMTVVISRVGGIISYSITGKGSSSIPFSFQGIIESNNTADIYPAYLPFSYSRLDAAGVQ